MLGNSCHSDFCYDHTSSSNFLYRLSPGEPEWCGPTGRGDGPASLYHGPEPYTTRRYQFTSTGSRWPHFGGEYADLIFGGHGAHHAIDDGSCNSGNTYRGSFNGSLCGGRHWGHTDLEIWRLADVSGGSGATDDCKACPAAADQCKIVGELQPQESL